ncbi:Exosome complex component Rrp41 like [Heracleum sosnowskyi]|uniref:Exosome complex component Rrp41 like n=1 Tax=Heracleum sosnowskyi TaxID=360622 RepID=A0AAD8N915_9APIA|nr:Exosome complex component Rrp41 like [Heracleum sosnowskyi]
MKIPEEINSDRISNRKTHSFTSNWTIASGSFDDSVSFESSESPIDVDGVDLVKKPPLVLTPSESDSSPCEITLTFMQKHEITQVYVRSTARVYEIYYKPDVHSSNEYLCTVRCSIVTREDDLLHESNHVEASIESTKESDRDYNEKKSPGSATEEDWVEVKSLASHVEVINSLTEDIIGDERSLKDFYEATAEISDGEPSVTLILRLLSLENKGHVYVDEVYVYADAVEATDLENHAAQNLQGGSSAGSSLMTMFLPTLLQLTRSNVGQSQDRLISNKITEEDSTDKGTRNNESTRNLNEHDKISKVPDKQDVKFQEVEAVTDQATPQFQKPAPILENSGRYPSVVDSNNYVGRVMEQLISRMSRIEDICLSFEEKMVRPLSSMEERLQRVENQLEIIVKNTQTSELPSCTRFSAPAFSSLDSASSSFYNDGCANPPYVQSEVEKHEPHFDDNISKSHEENLKSERSPQFIPSYVVTAPEFSCDEDDEQNDAVEPLKDSPCEKPKKPMSIDDALAAALAGFSSLTINETLRPSENVTEVTNEENDADEDLNCTSYSVDKSFEFTNEETAGEEHLKHTQGLKFTAPDFVSEDASHDDKVLTPRVDDVNLVHPSGTFATDGGENTLDIASAPSNSSVLEKEGTVIVEEDNVSEQFRQGHGDADSLGRANNCPSVQAKDDYLPTGETSMRESSSSKDKLSILDRFEIVKQLLAKTKDGVGTADNISGSISKCAERGSSNDISSFGAKDDHWASGEPSMQESSSSKDKLLKLDGFEILKQLLAKTMDDVGTSEEFSGPISKFDERGFGNDISSWLDFGTSILEVKFSSQDDTSSVLPLEALLIDPEVDSQISIAQRSRDGEITTNEIDLSSVMNEERMMTPESNTFPLVDLESYDAPVSSENAAGHQVPFGNKEHEVFSSLI